MERGGQPTDGGKIVLSVVRSEKMQGFVPLKAIFNSGAAAKIEKIRAAAHRRVPAVIDGSAVPRFLERAGPAAEPAALLEQFDLETVLHGRRRRGHARQSAADDGQRLGSKCHAYRLFCPVGTSDVREA